MRVFCTTLFIYKAFAKIEFGQGKSKIKIKKFDNIYFNQHDHKNIPLPYYISFDIGVKYNRCKVDIEPICLILL